MSSHSVFQTLQEFFPTVDARILKAVAIEHPMDADAAAEVVVNEVLPRISNSSEDQGSYSGIDRSGPSSGFDHPSSFSGFKRVCSTPFQSTLHSPKIKHFGSSSVFKHPDSSSAFKHSGSSSVSRLPRFSRGTKFRESSPEFKSRGFATRERRVVHENLMRPYPRRKDIDLGNSPHPGSASGHNVSCGSLQSAHSKDFVTIGNVYFNGSDNLSSSRKAAGLGGEVSLDHATCIDSEKTLHSNSANSDQEKRGWGIGSEEQTAALKCDDDDDDNNNNAAVPGMSANSVNGADGICAGAEHHELKDSTEHIVGDLQMVNPEKENHHVDSSPSNIPLGLESLVDQIGSTHVEDGTQTTVDIPFPSSSGSSAFNEACEMHCTNDPSPVISVEEEIVNSEDSYFKIVGTQSGCVSRTDVSEDIIEDAKNCEISCTSDRSAFSTVEESPCGEMLISEDRKSMSVLTQSGQAYRTDVLEEIIENAKSYKEILFSELESVISMMREVEYHEKAAEDAREEAAKGGLDFRDKVEELKNMLPHAKEANDMHGGEVYGEKAILATEVKELQSRLLSLSDEKDNSIVVLDEMRQTLEARLSAAEEARNAAEMEKLEKEVSAKKALAEQEATMEMVVQEMKLIKQQAEENSKLREFLVNRGRLVDALQGEISVICKDVKLLKEKLDQNLPLSESVVSLPTCKLASSSSSLKSKAFDLVTDQSDASKMILMESTKSEVDDQSVDSGGGEVSRSSNISSPRSVVECQSPRTRMLEERVKFDQEMLVDDGWEFCDEQELECET